MAFMGYWGTGVEPVTKYTESVLYCMEDDDDDDEYVCVVRIIAE